MPSPGRLCSPEGGDRRWPGGPTSGARLGGATLALMSGFVSGLASSSSSSLSSSVVFLCMLDGLMLSSVSVGSFFNSSLNIFPELKCLS